VILNISAMINKFYENKYVTNIIANQFHRLFYYRRPWKQTHWLGHQVLKCPFDLWVYQELIYKIKPDFIIECGTYKGGSAYFFASILDIIGKGKVITIDIHKENEILSDDKEPVKRPFHDRIQYLIGSTISQEILNKVKKEISIDDTVIVILDSNHTMEHVLQEMNCYSSFVTKGSYLIVEDSNLYGHPIRPERYRFGKGPFEAINIFLSQHNEFVSDKECEKYFMSFNPRGYLKKLT